MKKTIVVVAVLLLLGTAAMAAVGPVQGKKFEFSTAFGFSIQKYTYDDGYKQTITYFQIPLRVGFFLWKGLEFEPELLLTAEHYKVYTPTGTLFISGHETGYIMSGNLLYNFKMKSPRMIPFVLAGYGFGNGDLEGTDVDKYDTGSKTSLLNLGAGIKYLFGNIAALRFEYRFRGGTLKYTDVDTYTDKVQYHQVLLGLSLFF
jgi:opacity protein-like surface antigen